MSVLKRGRNFLTEHPKILDLFSLSFNKTLGLNKIRIKGRNNLITGLNKSFLRKSRITIVGNNNSIDIKEMSYLENTSIYIKGSNNKISIGKQVVIRKGDLYIEDDSNVIKIGNKTSIMGSTHIAVTEGKKVTIGENCMFSSDVVIRTGDSHSIINNEGTRINHAKDVILGDHIWLGNKTTILKGSVVKSNSIVGTGSIVTKVFNKENVILVGSPAKVVHENVSWLKERI